MFFGILLLIIGISIIIPKIPVFNIFLGAFLILLGISMFTDKHIGEYINFSKPNLTIFSQNEFSYNSNEKDYVTVFGNSTLDLSKETFSQKKKITVVSIFGNSDLKIGNQNAKLKAIAIFGSAGLPNKSSNGFGEVTENSKNFDSNKAYIDIEIISIFGSSTVFYTGGSENAF